MSETHLMQKLELRYNFIYASNVCVCVCVCVIYCLHIKKKEGLNGFSPTQFW